MYLNIKSDSVFVADSHYNERKGQFLIFLKKLKSEEIKTSQLFLMGDMFDFISGESRYFIKRNQELIDIINELSKRVEIIYLEGNHDYNMKVLFPDVLVVKRENQPLCAKYKDKSVQISHGDIFTPWHYDLYCKIIRNHPLLVFLNMIDFGYFISKKIYYTLIEKDICYKMKNFEEFAQRRLKKYSSDIVIEGHFHQGKIFQKKERLYVNIPSLCCENRYFRLNDKFIGEDL
ncbi:UDP-2,3-diacylglucosamine diphosphatase [Halarcobacter anaerophilus]|jgi:UDP-2,3-diacylglucosamine hydrolase|uniref:UDP-2,3-diacylglucosamine hydrolase n=1 Tax=Halarcobacter anaerophilus TaxID=877500 RepID=A0A4Q0Y1B5_9BACT|nr:UDP-2,3-diacylglucosamine diphosphatase [Halarcobacter anaerophilus]QDF28333.1 UDP-2,3-diacylglucosamine hydrolase [Halarcobacter anaerophilus]RXJ62001.1 UDP-2,3-diacylglucosamine hydrolase [Halarcobacter anaerophilus]